MGNETSSSAGGEIVDSLFGEEPAPAVDPRAAQARQDRLQHDHAKEAERRALERIEEKARSDALRSQHREVTRREQRAALPRRDGAAPAEFALAFGSGPLGLTLKAGALAGTYEVRAVKASCAASCGRDGLRELSTGNAMKRYRRVR